MTPRPGMLYVHPSGGRARVDAVEDGVVWGVNGVGYDRLDLTGYAPDWSDGATLGAVEHDVLAPAGWCIDREWGYYGAVKDGRAFEWRASLAEALRDALEVIDG